MKTSFQVYTYFGRVLATFTIPLNETHHKTANRAYKFALNKEKNGTVCWVRFV